MQGPGLKWLRLPQSYPKKNWAPHCYEIQGPPTSVSNAPLPHQETTWMEPYTLDTLTHIIPNAYPSIPLIAMFVVLVNGTPTPTAPSLHYGETLHHPHQGLTPCRAEKF